MRMAEMSEASLTAIIIAILAAAASLTGTIISLTATTAAQKEHRRTTLESRLSATERDNRLLWIWCRQLQDHIYRQADPPPPPPPGGLFTDPETP